MSSDSSIDSLIEQYLQRLEAGEAIDEAALREAHPDHAEELLSFIQLHRQAQSAFGWPDPGTKNEQNPLWAASARKTPESLPAGDSSRDGAGRSAWSWNRIAEAEFPLRFGPYELLEEINRGGMGVVYRAVHAQLQRVVALKVLRAGDLATAEEVQRFRTEAIASSALSHPNIIPIYEAGEAHGLFYFTMAYIDGEDLDARLKRQPMSPHELASVLLKITTAVACAHRQHVIHRDIKPSNILLDQADEPFLADFGLAHLLAAEDGLTMTGQILGTPSYMAPEQASGRARELTSAIDVYALGAVLYVGLTRQPPFSGPTPFDVVMQVIDRHPPRPSQLNRKIPRDLEAICLKAMAKAPEDRYDTAEALAEDFRCYLRGEPVRIDRPTLPQQVKMWWQREPVLVSHLCAVLTVTIIMIIAYLLGQGKISPERFMLKLSLMSSWGLISILMQYLARFNHHRYKVYLAWATADVMIYTTLVLLADSPRGLLLIGYPLMIVASGLFYRVRFVTFTTTVCILGVILLANLVDDPLNDRVDFLGIYIAALVVLSLCVVTMIRRIRGLIRFCGASE